MSDDDVLTRKLHSRTHGLAHTVAQSSDTCTFSSAQHHMLLVNEASIWLPYLRHG
jgi:hypothetical protein